MSHRMRGWGVWVSGSYVAHAHLDGGEDAEVLLGEVAKCVHVKLHRLFLLVLLLLQRLPPPPPSWTQLAS
jgi:hypothetical protein